jgi:hypothetical protein
MFVRGGGGRNEGERGKLDEKVGVKRRHLIPHLIPHHRLQKSTALSLAVTTLSFCTEIEEPESLSLWLLSQRRLQYN